MVEFIYQLLAITGLSTIVVSFIFTLFFLVLRKNIHINIYTGSGPGLTKYQRKMEINKEAIMEKVTYLRDKGKTWKFIANHLNDKGFRTQHGKLFRADNLYSFAQYYEGNRKKQLDAEAEDSQS